MDALKLICAPWFFLEDPGTDKAKQLDTDLATSWLFL